MKPILAYCFLLLILFSCSESPVFLGSGSKDNDTIKTSGLTSAEEEQLLKLVNGVRATGCDCGGEWQESVDSLTWDSILAVVAYKHSDDMKVNDYFSHTSLDGKSPGDRITAGGYEWWAYGENIAKGYQTAQSVMNGWLNSPGHCKNIMNGNVTEMGVGKSGTLWTQVFARPGD